MGAHQRDDPGEDDSEEVGGPLGPALVHQVVADDDAEDGNAGQQGHGRKDVARDLGGEQDVGGCSARGARPREVPGNRMCDCVPSHGSGGLESESSTRQCGGRHSLSGSSRIASSDAEPPKLRLAKPPSRPSARNMMPLTSTDVQEACTSTATGAAGNRVVVQRGATPWTPCWASRAARSPHLCYGDGGAALRQPRRQGGNEAEVEYHSRDYRAVIGELGHGHVGGGHAAVEELDDPRDDADDEEDEAALLHPHLVL